MQIKAWWESHCPVISGIFLVIAFFVFCWWMSKTTEISYDPPELDPRISARIEISEILSPLPKKNICALIDFMSDEYSHLIADAFFGSMARAKASCGSDRS